MAEGAPSKFVPAQEWMAQQHWGGHLADQVAGLRLETLGVPVHWEADLDARPDPALDHLKSRAADVAGAATIGLVRKFPDPRTMPGVEQAEAYDDSAENPTGSWFSRSWSTTS